MIYLITKMIAYLVAAGLIGFILGWALRSIGVEKAKKQLEYSQQDKLDALSEQHQTELAEFAQTTKQSRADIEQLESNNKALRETIESNTTALQAAQTEVVQLATKLKTADAFNKEILAVTGHNEEEFDATMDEREQALDSSIVEISESTLDESLIGTQDKTMIELENIGDAELSGNHQEIDINESDYSTTPEKTLEEKNSNEDEDGVEITMGNLWSHIGKVVGTKK